MNTSEHSSKVLKLYYDCFLECSPRAARIFNQHLAYSKSLLISRELYNDSILLI